jgi:hypothetical protein
MDHQGAVKHYLLKQLLMSVLLTLSVLKAQNYLQCGSERVKVTYEISLTRLVKQVLVFCSSMSSILLLSREVVVQVMLEVLLIE